ncbi:hypothetical protein [Rubritalea tangerina]|uniref:hypothetical protein n=1 Tax=Rubritalea tangerina TaxID=430798 RepID=UPI003623A787
MLRGQIVPVDRIHSLWLDAQLAENYYLHLTPDAIDSPQQLKLNRVDKSTLSGARQPLTQKTSSPWQRKIPESVNSFHQSIH